MSHVRSRQPRPEGKRCGRRGRAAERLAGAEGRVFSFVALAMPDHLHKLFTLMCFQCPMLVASNVWLPLPRADLFALLCAGRCLGFVVRDQCPERPQHPCLKSLLFEASARAAVAHHGIAVRVCDLYQAVTKC